MTKTHTAYPFEPTQTKDHTPTVCHVCGMRATGVGASVTTKDPRWLCVECVILLDRIRSVRRMDAYELHAIDGGVDAVADYIGEIGGKTELAEFDELEQRMLVKAAWQGCVRRLHEMLANDEAPF